MVMLGAHEGGGPIFPGDESEPSESAISSVSSYSSSPSDCGRPGNLAIRALMAERYNEDMTVGGQGQKEYLLLDDIGHVVVSSNNES